MSFLFPAFLLGLGALAIPLALHLIRRRVTREVPFPALRFLAPNRAEQRSHKLRRRLVLALRCLALAALAAAFARPFFGAPPATEARATVVVIDNSFSLHSPARWDAARRATREALGNPSPGDSIGLLLMNPRPAWLVAPTRDTAAALATLENLRPGWHATRAEPALRLAGEVLAATPARERRILYLGDHQAIGWHGADFSKTLPPGVTVHFPAPLPAPARQAALLDVTLAQEGEGLVASVQARNFGAAHTRTLSVFAEHATTPLLSHPVELAADEAITRRLPLPAPPAGASAPAFYRLALDADDLPADDQVWVLAPAARASERLLLLDRAASAPSAADYVGTAYAALAAQPPALRVAAPPSVAWPLPAVAVLRSDDSFAPEAAARLDSFLSAGGSALVFVHGGPAQSAWLSRHGIAARPAPATPARLRDWTLDHPLVEPLAAQNLRSLVGWSFARGWALPADALEPLAFWSDGSVALGETSLGSGRVLLAGFSPERREGDWPLSPAFVPFLHRAATHLLGLAAQSSEAPPRVGDPSPPAAPGGAWRALAGPADEIIDHKSSIINIFSFPGIYEHSAPGSPRRLLAVGLDPHESDPAPWPAGEPWKQLVSAEPAPPPSPELLRASLAAGSDRSTPLWWWAFAALALFALAELSLANRTAR